MNEVTIGCFVVGDLLFPTLMCTAGDLSPLVSRCTEVILDANYVYSLLCYLETSRSSFS